MENQEAIIFASLSDYANKVKRDISDLISIAVVSVENGKVLAYDSTKPIDNRNSAMYQVGIIRSAATALSKFEELKNKDIHDITITYNGQKHVLLLSESRKFLSHAILDKDANLMLAKRIMTKHIKEGTDELSAKLGSRNFIKKIDISL